VSLDAAIASIDATVGEGARLVSSDGGGTGAAAPTPEREDSSTITPTAGPGAVASATPVATDPSETATPAPGTSTPVTGDTPVTEPATTATPGPATSTPGTSALEGTWHVSDQGESFVGYRVREELARVGFQTAVGRTSAVTGSLTHDGQSITAVSLVADMTQLVSDDVRRENHLKGQSLQTTLYPTSMFVLTKPIPVGDSVVEGIRLSVTAIGDLTIHGVTQRVAIPMQGQLTGALLVVVGSLEIQFADYDIGEPNSGLVLSVEDHGVMEFQLVLEHE
jgi:polyisoprenoid-binding protein YceI